MHLLIHTYMYLYGNDISDETILDTFTRHAHTMCIYLCIHKYVYIHSKIHIPKYLYAQVAAKLPLCAEISQMYFKPKDIMNMPYISTNEPHISAKEPYICAKVPNTSAKEPSVDTICSPRYAEYTTRASFKKKE